MARVKVVSTARRRPGKCAISSDTQGPFLDTGKDIPRYGRIYFSVKWLKQRLHDAGLLNEAGEADPEVEELQDRILELEDYENKFNELATAVQSILPEPEPEVRTEVKIEVRDPSDEEIEEWVRNKGRGHPAVEKARRLEPGSSEEWFSLYGPKKATTPQEVADEVNEEPIHPDEPMQHFSIYDQEIDFDVVLGQNVHEVLEFSEDKGEGFPEALARREMFVAEREGRKPRKGVLNPLGFWNDETDEPHFPTTGQQEGFVDRDGGGTPELESEGGPTEADVTEEEAQENATLLMEEEGESEETEDDEEETLSPEEDDEAFNFGDDEDEIEDEDTDSEEE